MKLFDIIINNFWLKLFSLMLAVATWFYVFDLVDSDLSTSRKESLEQMLTRYDFVTKEVAVKPLLLGKTPDGYRVAFDRIKVDPPSIMIFGPRQVVNAINFLRTDKIELAEHTRSVKLTLGLKSDIKLLSFPDRFVDVYLPVEPVDKDK